MGRPREHGETTRAALLRAAEGLLAGGGVEALSVREVSRAAGTSTRAVYSLFGGKDGLCGALYRTVFQELRARVLALPETDDPSADLVRAGIEGFRPLALARPQLFRLAFEWPSRRSATTDADHREAQATFNTLVHIVDRAAGRRMRDAELRRIAYGFHALCQGLASGELAGVPVPDVDMSRLWRDSLTAYVKGIAAT